jgi:hypothetical protein
MARRVVWYGLAAVFPAAFAASGVGPFRCGIYGCAGGFNATLTTVLVAAAIGAVVGLLGMALLDAVMNGRYLLANRAEAKAQRLRDASQSSDEPKSRDST